MDAGAIVPLTKVAVGLIKASSSDDKEHPLGRLHISVDCRLDRLSVLAAVKSQLTEFRKLNVLLNDATYKEDFGRIRTCTELISFMPSPTYPWAVNIDLSDLLSALSRRAKDEGSLFHFYRRNILGALDTFLATNPGYLAHRARCVGERRSRGRPKMTSPEMVAIGCIALDWQRAGQKFPNLTVWLERRFPLSGVFRKNPGVYEWKNGLSSIKRCFKTVHLFDPTRKYPSKSGVRRPV
jgi:hypothetical protein